MKADDFIAFSDVKMEKKKQCALGKYTYSPTVEKISAVEKLYDKKCYHLYQMHKVLI